SFAEGMIITVVLKEGASGVKSLAGKSMEQGYYQSMTVKAAPPLPPDNQPPKVLSSSITLRTVAYQGNSTAGYLTVEILTDEPIADSQSN
ncbi:MAG: hypothetical protein AAGU27_12640, partial [Dehalobacterium sp.]